LSQVRRALLSVFDKQGLLPLARALHELDVELVSTGGTASALEGAGLPVRRVADLTGFPEMLDGRVKTLHPKIHGGILAVRGNAQHLRDLEAHGIAPIDLVVVNLYPFARTAADPSKSLEEVVEMIDVGGPSMVRAAGKNWEDVGVLVDPADYDEALAELASTRALSRELRRRLAGKAFAATAAYDAAIAQYLAPEASLPARLRLDYPKAFDLVYGENPHQHAAFYGEEPAPPGSIAAARALQGKPLSFNNILDFDAALSLAADLGERSAVIVKHGNPCGAAVGDSAEEAFQAALATDPTSAFGGVIAFGGVLDERAAAVVAEAFYEGVVATAVDAAARQVLARKKNLRVLESGPAVQGRRRGLDLRRVNGGVLAQEWDERDEDVRSATVATRRPPTAEEWSALQFAWTIVRHVKSNAIVITRARKTLGIGAGQMSRVDSVRLAIQKARAGLAGSALASDAFFPFRDGLDLAAEAGVTAVVQPGGSIRDEEVVAAAEERGMAMVLVGRRHFRH
jgi:phosphoribosylaminoimidazolecarboxamide formyltransferase/IMP cyclohydrolase